MAHTSDDDSGAIRLKFGQDFGKALCDHFGLPPNRTSDLVVHAGMDEVFSVDLKVALTAADLVAIGERMRAK